MPDDKSKRGKPDRARIAAGEPYEMRDAAKALGVTEARLRKVMSKVGNTRVNVYQAIKKKK